MLLFLARIIPYRVAALPLSPIACLLPPSYYTCPVLTACSCPLNCSQDHTRQDMSGTKQFPRAPIDFNVKCEVLIAMNANIFDLQKPASSIFMAEYGRGCSETLVHFYQTTDHRISEASNLKRF